RLALLVHGARSAAERLLALGGRATADLRLSAPGRRRRAGRVLPARLRPVPLAPLGTLLFLRLGPAARGSACRREGTLRETLLRMPYRDDPERPPGARRMERDRRADEA